MQNTVSLEKKRLKTQSTMCSMESASSNTQSWSCQAVSILKFMTVFLLLALLQGCTAPFADFYHGKDIAKLPFAVLPTGEPKLIRGNDQNQDSLEMLENNYMLVGYSLFAAARGVIDENGAVIQAKKVNASVAILYSKYIGSVSGSIPLTLPVTRNSSTSLYGSGYGSGGYTSYSGTAYTTTYGSETTYIPYTVDRFMYLVTYWIKRKPPIFGTYIEDLTPEIKQQIGSNKGLLVYAVIKGSPAYKADIVNGDILRKIGDVSMVDQESFERAISTYEGKKTNVTILRGKKEITKSVKLGTRSW